MRRLPIADSDHGSRPQKGREHEVFRVFEKWGLDAVEVGYVIGDNKLRVRHHGEIVAEIPNTALTDDALSDTAPLFALISKYLDDRMLARIALPVFMVTSAKGCDSAAPQGSRQNGERPGRVARRRPDTGGWIMRRTIAVVTVLCLAGAGWAQERVPQEQAVKFARRFADGYRTVWLRSGVRWLLP